MRTGVCNGKEVQYIANVDAEQIIIVSDDFRKMSTPAELDNEICDTVDAFEDGVLNKLEQFNGEWYEVYDGYKIVVKRKVKEVFWK